jgi:hypothetical protein
MIQGCGMCGVIQPRCSYVWLQLHGHEDQVNDTMVPLPGLLVHVFSVANIPYIMLIHQPFHE